MDTCPICRNDAPTTPPNWSGGRIAIHCKECGELEIGEELYEELIAIPANDNELSWLQGYVERNAGSRLRISKNKYGVFGAEIIKDRLTKLDKRRIVNESKSGNAPNIQIIYLGDPEE